MHEALRTTMETITLSRLLDQGQRELERATFFYYVSNTTKAEEHSSKTLAIFNSVLKRYSQRSGTDVPLSFSIDKVKTLCNQAIDIYSKTKQLKGKPASVDMFEKLKWLNSKVCNLIYPPVSNPLLLYVDKYDENFNDEINKLSESQLKFYDKWDHCSGSDQDWKLVPEVKKDLNNLYQDDLLSTCSLVSSLISISNNNPSLVFDNIQPHCKSYKYSVLLHVNGCKRLVLINDKLPISKDKNISLFLKSFSNSNLFWPALIEKAYFKVIGGNSYEFDGSNAGYDTYLLTGWIPEYVNPLEFFTKEQSTDTFWNCIFKHFKDKNCLLCVGTGKSFSKSTSSVSLNDFEANLIANHDYAIMDLKVTKNGGKQVLIKNPWLFDSRQIWYDYNFILNNFETIYINWNNKIFSTSRCLRFIYSLQPKSDPLERRGVVNEPQFNVTNKSAKPVQVWLLLAENISKFASRIRNYTLKLILVDTNNGEKILSIKGSKRITQTLKTSNTLALMKFELGAYKSVTAVVTVDHDDGTSKIISFNLFCYSLIPNPNELIFEKAVSLDNCVKELVAEWDVENPGGNWLYRNYVNNPQYVLGTSSSTFNTELQNSSPTANYMLTLFLENPEVFFNLQIFWNPDTGDRGLQKFDSKRLIYNEKYTSSGELSINLKLQQNSEYLILVSTYSPITDLGLQHLKYKLIVCSEENFSLKRLNTSLGLFVRTTDVNWESSNRKKVYFRIPRRSKIAVRIFSNLDGEHEDLNVLSMSTLSLNNSPKSTIPANAHYSNYRPKIRANIFSSSNNAALYYNNQFDDNLYGIFINDLVVDEGIYVLLIERFEAGEGNVLVSIGSETKFSFL